MWKAVVGGPASGPRVAPGSSLGKGPCEARGGRGGSVPPEGAEATASEATTASPEKFPLTTAQLPPRPSDLSRKPEPAVPLSAPANTVILVALGRIATAAISNDSRPSECQEAPPSIEEETPC